MGSVDSPITWVPYMNNNDCSQGFCSVYCPQWCYIIVPPPPPPIDFPEHNSSPNFSPLVIAIIGILACAILVVIYYTVISKYCGNTNSDHSIRDQNHYTSEQLENNQSPSIHEPWNVETTNGLDEAFIKSITVCKYKKGDGFIEGTDCSVCLSEFEENEKIRLLPKCSHAFHLPCIDTWLKSHSNCPMCRANIVCVNLLPPSQAQVPLTNESMVVSQIQRVNENVMTMGQEQQRVDVERVIEQGDQVVPKTPLGGYSDLDNSEERDTIIEIRGSSVSIMDHNSQHNRLLVADILSMNEDEEVVNVEQVIDFVGANTSFASGRF